MVLCNPREQDEVVGWFEGARALGNKGYYFERVRSTLEN
jgi:hypothetical protein